MNKSERNQNIDVMRALSMLLIVLYHSWVRTGSINFSCEPVYRFVMLGGEIGVTSFFALSGYGIYCSLYNTEKRGSIKWVDFMKKRLVRVLPQYYLSLGVILIFMDGAYYLSRSDIGDILTHALLIHNIFPKYFGEISGVAWTLGVIFQFYLIAIPLYKLQKKYGVIFWVLSIAFTVCVKGFVYAKVLPYFNVQDTLSFYAGRQLLTALDNFTTGMFVAYLFKEKHVKVKKSMLGCIIIVISLVLEYCAMSYGINNGIHTNNLSGYIWHSLIAICVGIFMFGISGVNLGLTGVVGRMFLWISKYEYGIYLWHLLFINNLVQKSPFVIYMINNGYQVILYPIFMILAVITGYIMSELVKPVEDRLNKMMLKKTE